MDSGQPWSLSSGRAARGPVGGFRNDAQNLRQKYTPGRDPGVRTVWVVSAMRRRAAGLGRLLVLLVVVDLGELRVDDIVLRRAAARSAAVGAPRTGAAPPPRLLLLGASTHPPHL